MWARSPTPPASTRARIQATPAPPLPEGCGPVHARLTKELVTIDGGIGDGETRGGTQEVGGPSSASRKRTTMKIVVRFLLSFFLNPALMPVTFTQHPPTALPASPRPFHGSPRLCESYDNSGIQPRCRKVLTTWRTTVKPQPWMTQR
jgi:hypothetical protein